MVIIIYSPETRKSITANLGRPDYSYYFVSSAFRAVLRRLAYVIETSHPTSDVDPLYEKCRSMGEGCVFLSFSPPHGTVTGLKCPTISVFAWEFTTIPTDPFVGDDRYDWTNVFCQHGCAITHSSVAVQAIRTAMGSEFPVWSIPAPVWDDYVKLYDADKTPAQSSGVDLTFEGHLIDFHGCDAAWVAPEERTAFIENRSLPKNEKTVKVHLDGIMYMTVFNPMDGRKNWPDLISSFVWIFRNCEDATLILKLVHYDFEQVRDIVTDEVFKLTPFKCRVVIVHGYLSDPEYAKIVRASAYVVNTSHGEGQCLPLMESMSAGKPAISPVHTAMEDYISEQNAFVVRSSAEIVWWPHDPRRAFRTTRYRIDWDSLCAAYWESYQVAKTDPVRYARLSRGAVESLQRYCSQAVVEERLTGVLRERVMACGAPHPTWRMSVRPLWTVWRFIVVPRLQDLIKRLVDRTAALVGRSP